MRWALVSSKLLRGHLRVSSKVKVKGKGSLARWGQTEGKEDTMTGGEKKFLKSRRHT